MKDLDTLIEDIQGLLINGTDEINEENLDKFVGNIRFKIKESFKKRTPQEPSSSPRDVLRVSRIGTPDRKLWFDSRRTKPTEESVDPWLQLKFLYGHILEELLLLLAKESGHTVTDEQEEIHLDGVPGHRDCRIDGVTVDVKSASKFSFSKFLNGSLLKGEDPFGYIAQLSGYTYRDKFDYGAFFVINKESGELALLKVDKIDMIDPLARIEHLRKNVLTRDSPPETKCYTPETHGKSGNKIIHKNCSYCPHLRECWKDDKIRAFKYSDGIKFFTEVVETPRVEEIPNPFAEGGASSLSEREDTTSKP